MGGAGGRRVTGQRAAAFQSSNIFFVCIFPIGRRAVYCRTSLALLPPPSYPSLSPQFPSFSRFSLLFFPSLEQISLSTFDCAKFEANFFIFKWGQAMGLGGGRRGWGLGFVVWLRSK